MSQETIEPKKEDIDEKNLAHFLDDYGALCKNYGLQIAGELVYGSQGIIIKPVVIKRPNESVK